MKDVWIQLEGEAEPFTVPVEDSCFIHKLRQAILAEKSRTLNGLESTDLVVYANKETYESSQRGEEGASKMEVDDQIRNYGITKAQALFVTVSQQPSPPSSPSVNIQPSRATLDQRKKRWSLLNKAMRKNKKYKKSEDSIPFSFLKWDEELQNAFGEMPSYNLVPIDIPEDTLTLLETYLERCSISLRGPKQRGGEAKLLHFIAPIIICVCSLFEGEIEITIERDMNGKQVKANGHFEFVLKRGNMRICIVEAKKEDMDKGTAQALVGCEVASELDQLSVVYAIVTDYSEWYFFKSCDDHIMTTGEITLSYERGIPERNSLKKIAGMIYSMLSE